MKSDFEKLVIAQKYIEAIEKENAALKAEVENQFRMRRKLEISLKIEKNRKEKMTPKEKLQVKTDLYVQQQKGVIDSLKRKLEESQKLVEQQRAALIRTKLGFANEKKT